MTRYEQLQRFASDERTDYKHAFLFQILTEEWVQGNKSELFQIDHNKLIKLSRLARNTYFKLVKDLAEFGYIDYQPATSRHGKTVVSFQSISTKSVLIKAVISTNPVPINTCYQYKNDTDNPDYGPETRFYDSRNVDLVHNNNHLINKLDSVSYSLSDDSEKGVQGKKPRTKKPHVDNRPKTAFSGSPLADVAKFQEALQAEFPTADLSHYHARLANWRDKHGGLPLRADWLSTAKTFLLNDQRDDKLFTNTITKPLNSNVNRSNTNNPTGSIIQPPAANERRRFGTW